MNGSTVYLLCFNTTGNSSTLTSAVHTDVMAKLVQHRFIIYLPSFNMMARLAFARCSFAYGAVLCLVMQDIEYAQVACSFFAGRLFLC